MANMKKIWAHSPYEKTCEKPYHQIVYLRYVEHLTPSEIERYTNYALSTIRSYMYKYADFLDEAKEYFTFHEVPEHALIENPHKYFIYPEDNYFYLVKFYDENEKFLTSKVGTTDRSLDARLRELFRSNTPYSKMNASYLVINKVYKCNGLNEGVESYLKGLLIKKYPGTHKGNDQFEIDLNWDEWDEIIKDYLYN